MKAEVQCGGISEIIPLPENCIIQAEVRAGDFNFNILNIGSEFFEEFGISVTNMEEIAREYPNDVKLRILCCDVEGWEFIPEILSDSDYTGLKFIEVQLEDFYIKFTC